MRFVMLMHNFIHDPNTGAMHALRTQIKWLAQAGHDCRVLCTARFDTDNILDIPQHLSRLGLSVQSHQPTYGRPWLLFPLEPDPSLRVHVELLQTQHNDMMKPDQAEGQQFLLRLQTLCADPSRRPDVLITYGKHTVIPLAMKLAQQQHITTVVSLHNEGFEMPEYFTHAHHATTCSRFLSTVYRNRMGIASTPLVPALDWSQIVAPTENRAMVTFVNPSLPKGASLIARLAVMLGEKRPDIPLLIVQSGSSAAIFNSIPGIDFSKYPSILAAPAVPHPKDYLSLTKILLVPSTWPEPFGRVAAEAMINGIPPLVSPRGALPDVVFGDHSQAGGGLILPLPDWLDRFGKAIVNDHEAQPWFDAIVKLWDDPHYYQQVASRARALAEQHYSEPVLRKQYVDYFTSLRPTQGVMVD